MRTTVEIDDALRAELLHLAAVRGEKGFSRIVGEAVQAYLANLGREDDRSAVARLRGVFSAEVAESLRREVRAIRESWR